MPAAAPPSQARGDSLVRTQLHHLVDAGHRANASGPAVTSLGTTVTYAALRALVRSFAGALVARGTRPGERVAVWLDKRLETVGAIFGTSSAAGVVVPVNPALKPAQVRHILAHNGARVLITSPERWSALAANLDDCPGLHLVVTVGPGATPPTPTGIAVSDWEAFLDDGIGTRAPVRGVETDPAAILYTSGSTGKPKGVALSHRNLVAGAESVSHYLGNRRDDVILAALPLSFDAGLSQLTTAFAVGAHVVLHNYLLPADVVRRCEQHQVTGLTGVPPLWMQLAEQSWPVAATASLRYFANTGGRMPRPTLRKLRDIFPAADPYLMYGLTEAFRSTYLDPKDVDRHPDSIGRAIPNADILLIAPDGSPCSPGQTGELVHRGPLVALGYWNDPEATAQRFRPVPAEPSIPRPDVAVWSGDLVRSDEEGYLYFVGRTDEMIKTSGYRVSPTELEEVAYASGAVRDAVALGCDHPRLGQQIVLVVTARQGEAIDVQELTRFLRAELPAYMVPRRIMVREGTLPRSPNGKFDRPRIRAELQD
jgi:acyl-CoA ligase (AMP-forming) (exosortase A-associated)